MPEATRVPKPDRLGGKTDVKHVMLERPGAALRHTREQRSEFLVDLPPPVRADGTGRSGPRGRGSAYPSYWIKLYG